MREVLHVSVSFQVSELRDSTTKFVGDENLQDGQSQTLSFDSFEQTDGCLEPQSPHNVSSMSVFMFVFFAQNQTEQR